MTATPIDTDPAPTPSWWDVAGDALWPHGTAECGCTRWAHITHDFDEYSGEKTISATLHDPTVCTEGLDVAHVPVAMRAALRGLAVPAGTPVVAVERATLAAVLRELPATDTATAMDAVAAEVAAEAVHTAAGTETIEAYLQTIADAEALEDEAALEAVAEAVSYRHLPIDDDPAALWFAATCNPLSPTGEYRDDGYRRRAEARVRHEAALAGEVATPEAIEARVATVVAAAEAAETATAAAPPLSMAPETSSMETAPLRSSWREEMQFAQQLWAMTPGLATVAGAADSFGAGREGVLAVVLARVAAAVPPDVRMVRADGRRGLLSQGGSLNFYSAPVGKPGSGKTVAMSAAEGLVPLPPGTLVPEGTAEGMIKSFAYMRREKSEDGTAQFIHTPITDTVMMVADEIDAVLAEMVRQGTKFGPVWRSMWMGTMVGTTTGNIDLRTRLAPHSYRFSAVLGCQPTATAPLWAEGDRGTPQRILWLPVSRQARSGLPEPGPLRLAFQKPVSMLPPDTIRSIDDAAQPVWIDWSPAAHAHVCAEEAAAERDNDPYGEFDDDDDDEPVMEHETLMRLKIHVLLAIMDALEQPTDVHWEAAGIIMRMREACMRRTKARATRAGTTKAERAGHMQGVQRASARRGEDEAAAAFGLDLSARIIAILGQLGGVATGAAIIRLLSKKQKPHGRKMLMRMAGDGSLRHDPGSDGFSFAG